MLGIGTAVLLGLIIGIAYMFMCRKERYNRDFIIGLVILPAIVAAVILLIGSNVARAFSMAGAFALVRFRSVPGSAKDIAIVFFAMASGLACGLGYVTFACVFVVIMIVILILLTVFNFAQPHTDIKQLRITIPESLNYSDVFNDVMNVIEDRRQHPKEGSYTNYLFDKGIDKILKKCGEEATEIIIAAKNPDPEEIKYEISDFLYHVMVLMVLRGVTWEDIVKELANR